METKTSPAKKQSRVTINPRQPNERTVLKTLRDLVRAYTRHHDDLEIDHGLMSANFAISLRANDDDQGKLVGGGGGNIWALKLIFKIIGLRMNKRMQITLLKPKLGKQEPLTPFEPALNFDYTPIVDLLSATLSMVIAEQMKMNVADVGEETHFELIPSPNELMLFRGDVTNAFRNLITAIGKSQGRKMILHLADPETASTAPVMSPSLLADASDIPLLPYSSDNNGPIDPIDEEARSRGFVQ